MLGLSVVMVALLGGAALWFDARPDPSRCVATAASGSLDVSFSGNGFYGHAKAQLRLAWGPEGATLGRRLEGFAPAPEPISVDDARRGVREILRAAKEGSSTRGEAEVTYELTCDGALAAREELSTGLYSATHFKDCLTEDPFRPRSRKECVLDAARDLLRRTKTDGRAERMVDAVEPFFVGI